MSLANNVDPRSSGLPDTSFYYKPDEAIMSMQNRAQLGMIKDTLGAVVVPFTQMQNPSKNYQATPDRPLLDMNLINVRVLLKPNGDAPPEPGPFYNAIISYLPEDLQAQFNNPPLTDPLLIAMDKVFNGAATGLSLFDSINKAPPLDSPMESNMIAFGNLPTTLSESFSSFGSQLLSGLGNGLQLLGRNDPNYDSLSNLINQTSDSFDRFQQLLGAIKQSPQPQNLNDLKDKVSDDVNRLSDLYHSKDNGSDLQLLGSFVNALTLLSSSLTTTQANPSLMLAASLGNMGIETSKSSTGVLGPGLAAINQNVSAGLGALYMPERTPGDKNLLTQLLNTTSVYGLGVGTSFANANYGEASLDYPKLNNFGYEAGLAFLGNTSALPKMFGLLGSAAGISSGNIEGASKAMSASFLLQLVYAGAKGSPSSFESLVNLVSEPLSKSLADVEQDLNTGISNGTISGEKANAINVGLTHARLALENGDYEGFSISLNNLFEEFGTNSDQVQKDLKTIKSNGEVIQNAFSGANKEGSEAITGIQRMA